MIVDAVEIPRALLAAVAARRARGYTGQALGALYHARLLSYDLTDEERRRAWRLLFAAIERTRGPRDARLWEAS